MCARGAILEAHDSLARVCGTIRKRVSRDPEKESKDDAKKILEFFPGTSPARESCATPRSFRHPRGDLISLLVVYTEYARACGCRRDDGAEWARENALRLRAATAASVFRGEF